MAEPATWARLPRDWTSDDGPSRMQRVQADGGRAIEKLPDNRTDRRHRDPRWKDTRPCPSLGTAHRSVSKTGLVLVGGGARGAYQAGVLQGLAEIVGRRFGDRPPFDVVTGISAGAINAAYLASRGDRMAEATGRLAALWADVRIDRVMRTDAVSLFSPCLCCAIGTGARTVLHVLPRLRHTCRGLGGRRAAVFATSRANQCLRQGTTIATPTATWI